MKGVNLARKASKEPDHEDEPEATRPRRRKGAKAASSNATPIKTPQRRVRMKGHA